MKIGNNKSRLSLSYFNIKFAVKSQFNHKKKVQIVFFFSFLLTFSILGVFASLKNEGFEDGAGAGGGGQGSLDNWSIGGSGTLTAAAQDSDWARETGETGAWLKGWETNIDRELYQEISVSPGWQYDLQASLRINGNFLTNGGTIDMRITWLDSGSTPISNENLDIKAIGNDDNAWHQYTLNDKISPNGAVKARISFFWTTDGNIENSGQTSVMLDNVFFAPEPSSLAFVLSALLLFFRRRRNFNSLL